MSNVRLRYETVEFGEIDIHVRGLRDLQEFSDDDGEAESLGISSATWSIFGVLWESSHVLAHLMARYEVGDRRVLEVGCGLGLASLVLNRRGVNITATDVHPEAGAFLEANVALNGDPSIPFFRTAWADADAGLGLFGLIIGSDVLYEAEHAAELAGFVDRHACAECEVIVIDSGRNQHGRFRRQMAERRFVEDELPIRDADSPGAAFAGRTMRYRR